MFGRSRNDFNIADRPAINASSATHSYSLRTCRSTYRLLHITKLSPTNTFRSIILKLKSRDLPGADTKPKRTNFRTTLFPITSATYKTKLQKRFSSVRCPVRHTRLYRWNLRFIAGLACQFHELLPLSGTSGGFNLSPITSNFTHALAASVTNA